MTLFLQSDLKNWSMPRDNVDSNRNDSTAREDVVVGVVVAGHDDDVGCGADDEAEGGTADTTDVDDFVRSS